ncbi:MAG: PilN domain-containing protein [Armatimonadota bacterium]
MSLRSLDLLAEWASQRRRAIRQAQLWTLVLLASSMLMAFGTLYFLFHFPQAIQQRALWQARMKRMEKARVEPPPLPFPKERLQEARTRTLEFNLILMAITRLLPRAATLQEATIAHQPDTGLTITLRGSTQGFEPVRLYTERLRNTGLFADVTPLSVTRTVNTQQQSQFEIRLTVPVPAESPTPAEGGTPP